MKCKDCIYNGHCPDQKVYGSNECANGEPKNQNAFFLYKGHWLTPIEYKKTLLYERLDELEGFVSEYDKIQSKLKFLERLEKGVE